MSLHVAGPTRMESFSTKEKPVFLMTAVQDSIWCNSFLSVPLDSDISVYSSWTPDALARPIIFSYPFIS